MIKRSVIIALLILALAVLVGCDSKSVRINSSSLYVENIVLPLRHGYEYAEDCYSVEDTENGYDIIVHVVRRH